MEPGASIDPVWLLMATFTAMETLVTLLLVMPMPSNRFRGGVLRAVADVWHSSKYIKRTAWVLVSLNGYYFWDCMRSLLTYNQVYAATCESRAMVLYLQRNTFISALSILMFLVMRRLLDIQQQLFSTRALVKEAMGAMDPSAATSPRNSTELPAVTGSESAAAQRSRAVKAVLRRLEHSVSTAMQEEPNGAQHGPAGSKHD